MNALKFNRMMVDKIKERIIKDFIDMPVGEIKERFPSCCREIDEAIVEIIQGI